MTILGYSLDEAKKAVLAFVVSAAALVGLFVAFDPSLTEASVAVVVALFNVLAVFNAPRHSYADVSKTLVALVASGVALVGFFHTFNPGETEKIIAVAGAVLNTLGVFWVQNQGKGTRTAKAPA
jgi:hypothetical protein